MTLRSCILRASILCICSFPLLILSEISCALSCADVTNQIRADIIRYSEHVQNKHLPWMQLSWLKNNLGNNADKIFLSGGEIQYTWKCPEDESNFISVIRNKNGILTQFSGQYSSDTGSGSFTIDKQSLAEQSDRVTPEPQVIAPKQQKKIALSSKYDLIKRISNDLEEYS